MVNYNNFICAIFTCLFVGGLGDVKGLFDSEPDLFLTVSSEPDCPRRAWYKPWTWFTETKCDRRLELNWINFDTIYNSEYEDYVGIFLWDPVSPSSPQPPPSPPDFQKCPVKSRSEAKAGYYKTTVRFEGKQKMDGGLEGNSCLGYWIAYVRTSRTHDANAAEGMNSTFLKSKCLRLYPTWMSQLKEAIGDVPVTSLIIPGTHNSGSWERYNGLLQSEINPVAAYEITQEHSIYEQLMHGIRYLDLRVTHRPLFPRGNKVKNNGDGGATTEDNETSELFWISHDTILGQIPLTAILQDVQRFQEETNGEEIVFVDFHRVTISMKGVNQSEQEHIHSQLIELVDKYLGRYLVPTNSSAVITPNQLWKWRKTVFVTYPHPIRERYSFLWPIFKHSWANTNNIPDLENYLGEDLQVFGCQRRFWALMTELTPTTRDILTRPHLGLRGMAQSVNRNVTTWFRRKAWYSRAMSVASDFFLGNNLIEMAIKVNQHGAFCTP